MLWPMDGIRAFEPIGRTTQVLVVEANDRARGWDAAWLDEAGYEVTVCPGPSAPDYSCVGARTGACPLATPADVVVLDMVLAGDVAGDGARAWELLLLYHALGRPVVAVRGAEDPFVPLPGDDVVVVERPVTRERLLAAVRAVTATSMSTVTVTVAPHA